ncbi:hypothetical protein C8J56DRAFT_1082005 [Mycena floridula]|nr:hypothetical protein C8J56DRAFT_1082005 [Mycena floridula]
MPSFSLVDHFGKQRKAIVDSPVSSGPVEQHVSPTITESSHSQIRQPSEAGNVFSGTRAANSHGLTSGLVALSQHMEGVSIRDIKGPVMSNNHVDIINYYEAQDHSNALLRVGDICLEEEVESYLYENSVWRTTYKGQIMASSTWNISIWSYRGERAVEKFERAYQVYASLPRHPNILQLYGICRSPLLTALHKQYESAHSILEAHNLRGWVLRGSDVDESGKLVIAQFFPGPTVHSAFDPRICTAFETNTFIKEDLLDYYKVVFDMISWPTYLPTSTLPSPLDKAAPFQLSHPEVNLPVYSLPGWNKVVNGMNITVGQTGMVLTLLPTMTIRCCIPTPQIPTFSIMRTIRLFKQDDEALFVTWACQANHLIHDLPVNIMDLQTELFVNWIDFECHAQSIPDWKKDTESSGLENLLETKHFYLFCPLKGAANIYWSQDEEGQHIIEDSLIQAAFGITARWHGDTAAFTIPSQFYEILSTIHESCGFNQHSTQVAEYLGLPLAVINDGYSRLEEYVEDPEYTSESESGDSDYLSASEDV